MTTSIRFKGGGERVVPDAGFVMDDIGVRYTDESSEGNERRHTIPWDVIHEIVQEQESLVVVPDQAE